MHWNTEYIVQQHWKLFPLWNRVHVATALKSIRALKYGTHILDNSCKNQTRSALEEYIHGYSVRYPDELISDPPMISDWRGRNATLCQKGDSIFSPISDIWMLMFISCPCLCPCACLCLLSVPKSVSNIYVHAHVHFMSISMSMFLSMSMFIFMLIQHGVNRNRNMNMKVDMNIKMNLNMNINLNMSMAWTWTSGMYNCTWACAWTRTWTWTLIKN